MTTKVNRYPGETSLGLVMFRTSFAFVHPASCSSEPVKVSHKSSVYGSFKHGWYIIWTKNLYQISVYGAFQSCFRMFFLFGADFFVQTSTFLCENESVRTNENLRKCTSESVSKVANAPVSSHSITSTLQPTSFSHSNFDFTAKKSEPR